MKERSSVRQQLACRNILTILLYLMIKQNQHFKYNHAVTKERKKTIFDIQIASNKTQTQENTHRTTQSSTHTASTAVVFVAVHTTTTPNSSKVSYVEHGLYSGNITC
jgi:hypothetical protein